MKRITISFPWPVRREDLSEFLAFTFQAATITFVGLYLAEAVASDVVARYFDLNVVLWWVIVSGLLALALPRTSKEASGHVRHTTRASWIWFGFLAVAAGVIVGVRAEPLGRAAIPLAVITVLGVFGMIAALTSDRLTDPS